MRKLITLRLPEETIAKVKAQKGGYTHFIEDAINYRLRYFERLEDKKKKTAFIDKKAKFEEQNNFETDDDGEAQIKEPHYSDEEREDAMKELFGKDYKPTSLKK